MTAKSEVAGSNPTQDKYVIRMIICSVMYVLQTNTSKVSKAFALSYIASTTFNVKVMVMMMMMIMMILFSFSSLQGVRVHF